jgi:hypothetical protein
MTRNHSYSSPQAPVVSLLQAHKLEKKRHRELVAQAQDRAQDFIKVLATLPYREKSHALTMDLISLFERFCGFDLPNGFTIEFGRKVNKACRDGLLPFQRRTFGRASLAGFKGIDADILVIALRNARKPAV